MRGRLKILYFCPQMGLARCSAGSLHLVSWLHRLWRRHVSSQQSKHHGYGAGELQWCANRAGCLPRLEMGSLLAGWQLPRLLPLPPPLPHGDGGRLPRHHVPLHPLHLPPCHGGRPGHRSSRCRLSHLRRRDIQHGEAEKLFTFKDDDDLSSRWVGWSRVFCATNAASTR